MKKFLSIFLAIVMCFTVAVPAFAVNTTSDLQFNADGKFKIMQIADIQDGFFLNTVAEDFLNAVIDMEKPDLIVLTGDNISDSVARGFTKDHSVKKVRKAIEKNFFGK